MEKKQKKSDSSSATGPNTEPASTNPTTIRTFAVFSTESVQDLDVVDGDVAGAAPVCDGLHHHLQHTTVGRSAGTTVRFASAVQELWNKPKTD